MKSQSLRPAILHVVFLAAKSPRYVRRFQSAITGTRILTLLAFCLGTNLARAVDYHVKTAQDLQTALTLAAGSSTSNNIYITNGYYAGNFNYNSSSANDLTILAEPGVTNTQITIDGGGTGSSMSIVGSGTANITVEGMTFLRNCGNATLGGLQISGGNTEMFVSGCLFLSTGNSSGAGLAIGSGLNVTVTNCIAVGSTLNDGIGISISGVSSNVTIQNCTISTNGFGNNGFKSEQGLYVSVPGTIFVTGSTFVANSGNYYSGTAITFTSNTVTGNLVNSGISGAYCVGTTITLTGNNFTENSVGWPGTSGGGAYCSGTTITLSGNSFTRNSAINTSGWGGTGTLGGGAYCQGSAITLYGNTFIGNGASGVSPCCGNNAFGRGGGVYCSGNTILSNNIFIANSATGNPSIGSAGGGGAYCSGTTMASGNTFLRNASTGLGGGLYALGPTVQLLDNLVASNSVTYSTSLGGGVWVDAGTSLDMVNNTITANTSLGNGGGVAYIITGTVEFLNVYNNIIWGNSATGSGGDVWLSGTGQKKIFAFNDVDNMYGVWDLAQNNLDLAPKFFDPVNGDYHIQGSSPCVNAGTTNAPILPATDLDGNPLFLNGVVPIGCYSFITTIPHPADTNGDFTISLAEFNAYAAAWKNAQPWIGTNSGPNPISANYLTRAGYITTNGGAYHNDGSARPLNWKLGR